MIPGLLYQKTTRTPNASQKNDSGELSLKGFKVQGSGFKIQLIAGFSRIVSPPLWVMLLS